MVDWAPHGGFIKDFGGSFTDPKTVTATEGRLLDSLSPFELLEFNDSANDARSAANSFYPPPEALRGDFADDGSFLNWAGNDGHNDAFRHAYWNALTTDRLGEDFAEQFTTAHEGFPGDINEAAREAMDLYNNSVGRRIAVENPNASDAELAALVQQANSDGELTVIDANGDLAWSDTVPYGQHGPSADVYLPGVIPVPGTAGTAAPANAAQSPSTSAPADDPAAILLEEDVISSASAQPEPATEAAPAASAPKPQPAPEPPAQAANQPAPQGQTLADLLGDDDIDPNEEGRDSAPPSDEDLRSIYDVTSNQDDEDEQDSDTTGSDDSNMPNPVDDGPSYGSGDYTVLLNRNAPYVNPGSGDFDTFAGSIDYSGLLNRNAPYVNPGSGDFDMPVGSTDFSVLLNRNAPYVNPGPGDIDLPVGNTDISVLFNRNGPRTAPGPDDEGLASSAVDGGISDLDFGADLDDLASFEIL